MMKTDFQHFPAPHQQWWHLCLVNSAYIPWHKKKRMQHPTLASCWHGWGSRLLRRSPGRPQSSIFSFVPSPNWIRQKRVLHRSDISHHG